MGTDVISELDDFAYLIDLSQFEESDRSLVVIAQHCLCPDCRERLASEPGTATSAWLVTNVRACCSNVPGFINPKLPLLEKVFRLLLSEGNRPLRIRELMAQLSFYSECPVSLSFQTLARLLDSSQYYGFARDLDKGNPS